ncbi:hypothetical protein PHMEG_00029235, partial [Phytophthora megakarya]
EVFWAKRAVALKLLESILKCLAHFESDRVCLSVVYQQFVELRSQPYTTTLNLVLDNLFKNILGIELSIRWGYGEAKEEELQRELTQFMLDKLSWNDDVRSIYYKSSPPEWWAPLAQMGFTIPSSSAAAERSWCIFKFRHSSQRNRLNNETNFKLAFIYSNKGAKDAIGSILDDRVGDFEVETSSLPSQSTSLNNVTDVVDDEILRKIQEKEQLGKCSSECDDDGTV